ncbi:UDP-N-acetylglucosamine 1-carboxyvinyltransferase [Rhodopirellula sp. MGV]|uniref:UDP-N-acetylglucosamine 1-carboxyvinyltransferase n=1 Tax=Rhodopirellula sp. MGV TaxID=2023130 RepID=UPI000B976373|nr:UDP-N-acetylglucosamine 1-carboxyvinyltransferase [Rhodopirellula sp. MGV]OYP34115.1 UDP-N-acetylglucosamine 1-carboxyvinyltransferase [Rhodopirellula sp. MGV]PNY35627.1 UDP-N-acetylglucosamine 1-carboxyvinyltransferase [Rhodopirellula baltica]PNY37362.1 UDP-N-acetylglucosamine 1-carboxyvinyltransferase [Rhodopirellula baltica]
MSSEVASSSETENSDVLTVFPSKLYGEVTVSGAKNSALRLLAASLLTADEIQLFNYPSSLLDAQLHVEMLRALGKECTVTESSITIKEATAPPSVLNWNRRSIRNTLLILGALVARTGAGHVPLPGGCQIGASAGQRAYDLHVMVLETLGARVIDHGDSLEAVCEGGLIGADIHLPIRSTGATENALLCGALAKGTTRIWNPHIRPEIIDLISMLRSMGAQIEVFGQERIEIQGEADLSGTKHRVIPDNVEALTWVIAAVLTDGEIEIHDFPFEHLEVPLIYLRESGAKMFRGENSMVVRGGNCYPLELSTGPYPGINSDMQPILAVYGLQAKGESRFIDLRFPGRYGYAEELAKMGADYTVTGNMLRINGGKQLTGAAVRALDLRAGAALALAGLIARGPTHIHDSWQLFRGYSGFPEKARALGVRLTHST